MEKDIKDPANEVEKDDIVDTTSEQAATADDSSTDETAKDTPEAQIAKLEAQIAELKKQNLYKAAEFDNFRKRVMQEKAELIKNGGSKVITTLLPIIDDLERAQENMDKYEDVAALREGLTLIIDKFFKLLAQEGLKKMEVVGTDFSSDLHVAFAMVPGLPADQKGKIIDC
ncbi:MAG: nucleotide exchange factor GrpE, partial [Bacteroidales bacterium]|nr:nucleotide exchange factor GrpE [Bacteroidales bacterium]